MRASPSEGQFASHPPVAVGAEPDEFQHVFFDFVACLIVDAIQQKRQITAIEFDRGAALPANEVMVMAVRGAGVTMTTLVGMDTSYVSHPGEQLQGTIYSYQAHGWAVLSGTGMKLRWTRVSV